MSRYFIILGFTAVSLNIKLFEISGLSIYSSLLIDLILLLFALIKGLREIKHVLYFFLLITYGLLLGYNLEGLAYAATLVLFVLFSFIKLNSRDHISALKWFVAAILITDLRVLLDSGLNLTELNAANRLSSDFCGGINNLAYFNVFGFILSFFSFSRFGRLLQVFFFLFIVLTLSRGALIVVIIFIFFNYKVRDYLPLAGIILGVMLLYAEEILFFSEVLARRYVLNEISERAGRSDIWLSTLETLLNPTALVGHGLGTFSHNYRGDINVSTHNQYLDFVYVYGWILSIATVLILITRKFITVRPKFMNWIGIAFFLSLIFDSRLYVIQTVFWSSVLLNIYLHWNEKKESLNLYY